ncbi:class I SAM-dependent methyltransferase [Nitrosopumilus sp.]|uniref:class I SAM-dependent methyltransferase n=1 Tax=Nitrosopumilus sp. TaxID=2024843 RepID=UPI0029317686|nr:class I SAM-dependent methyltransferase [Nitrosopumilus sp.]
MTKNNAISLYKKYHIDRDDQRLGQFVEIREKFQIKSVMYPGCFVHITPSFVFPKVVYVDSYKKANIFFDNPKVLEFIRKKKEYKDEPDVLFYHRDYTKNIVDLDDGDCFDLLVSQYAGFVSQHCKKYLKPGGVLLVNNSHGDATMASIDKDYELVGVLNRKNDDKYSFSEKDLSSYFIPKKPVKITKKYVRQINRGIGYTKSASAYIFRKT